MRLADQIAAVCGTDLDLDDIMTKLASGIARAQRFKIDDDVARAAVGVVRSKPSSLVAALPLCRLPYPVMWLEWDCASMLGTRGNERDEDAPTPQKMGVLIEALSNDQLQVGQMTWAWVHADRPDENVLPGLPNMTVCPFSIIFDWREDGNLLETLGPAFDKIHKERPNSFTAFLAILTDPFLREGSLDLTAKIMRSAAMTRGWDKLADNPREVEAVHELIRHATPWVSTHAQRFLMRLLATIPIERAKHMLASWQADLQGEEPFAAALITMMNSRNCVDHEPANLDKLNRSRRRGGKPEFLAYSTTRLRLSQHLDRAVGAGHMTRAQARGTLVRGHFKLRRTGVFWWSPHERGDQSHRVPRREYEVVP